MSRTLLPISSEGIRAAIDRGDLKAVHIGHRLMVDSGDLAAFLKRRELPDVGVVP